MCGDSTSSDDVAKLMNGYKAELLFTSPPYSDMRDYNGSKDLSVDNLIEFIPTFLPYAEYQVVNLGIQRKDNEIVQYWDDYINKAKECGYKFLSWNIWSRRGMGGSIANMSAMFRMEHEWIFVFGKKRKDLNDSQKNQSAGLHTGITNRQKDGSTKKSKPKIVKEFGRLSSIIEMSYGNSKEHPAVFPIEFPSEYIKAMTNTNNIIVDCFLGSGTTLIAAEKLNRKCYGMELDEKYCDVIINRWEQFTGLKAIKNGTK
jgi:DNA modification methylase